VLRVHQEDLCQALSVPPDRKYGNEGGPGVERVASLSVASPTR
jgi:serine/threonine-protein kinase HipA